MQAFPGFQETQEASQGEEQSPRTRQPSHNPQLPNGEGPEKRERCRVLY